MRWGCRLVLNRVASERVLSNLRQCLPARRPQLLDELRALAAEGVRTSASGLNGWLEALAMDPPTSTASAAPPSPPCGASWPSAQPCSTGKVRAPPPPLPPPASATSTTPSEARGCCWLCGSSAGRARSPSRSYAWGTRVRRATRASARWQSAGGWSRRPRRLGYL